MGWGPALHPLCSWGRAEITAGDPSLPGMVQHITGALLCRVLVLSLKEAGLPWLER